MIKPIIHLRQDDCPICNAKRSMELYDRYNKPLYLSMILDTNQIKKINTKRLYYFKCRRCGRIFDIDWNSNRDIPYPLSDNKKNQFIKYYNSLGNLINIKGVE